MVTLLGSPAFQIIPPTTNVLARTFFIKSKQTGTVVLVDYGNETYLITANHLIAEPYEGNLMHKKAKRWETWAGASLIARDFEHDVAIFTVPYINGQERLSLKLDSHKLHMGQHVHFLGFPLMLEEYVNYKGFENRPMPFERGAIVSMIGTKSLILDAHNVVGFSGGPVVFYKDNEHVVCEIITGYKEEICSVEMRDDDWKKELDAIYKQNTGITYACDADDIKKLIDETRTSVENYFEK